MRSLSAVAFVGGLLLTGSLHAAPELIQVDKSDGTWFKSAPIQSSALGDNEKCELADNDVMEYSSISPSDNNHFFVELPRAYSGCGLEEGYLYRPHVSTHATTITVLSNTVFKRDPIASSDLDDSDKCDLPGGLHRLSSSSGMTSAHYAVNFANIPEGCGFSSGYVWEGHADMGIQAISNRQSALLKRSTADSSTLPDSDKCTLPSGGQLLSAAPVEDDASHYKVTLNTTPEGCGFRSGYIWYGQFNLAEPEPEPEDGDYAWPQPGSDLGSAWCICRNIGSSPHIGQDFVQWGAKHAVAVEAGTISSITYSSSCGYFVNLTDQFGGVWRYVHLNNPAVRQGEAVSRGQFLANISNYPKAACGTGPHLHLERRSSGEFGDSATGRSCQYGYRACYYDPLTPFGGSNFAQSVDTSKTYGFTPMESRSQLDDVAGGECRIDPAHYAQAPQGSVGRYEMVQGDRPLRSNVSTMPTPSSEDGLLIVSANVHLDGNPENRCDLEKGQNCITSWQLLAEKDNGDFARLFFDAGVRNSPVIRVEEERYCIPDDATGRFDVLVDTASGERYRMSIRSSN